MYNLEHNDKAMASLGAIVMSVMAMFAADLAFSITDWMALVGVCIIFGGLISNAILLIIMTWSYYKVE